MKKIFLREAGILPGEDCTLALDALINENLSDAEFVFEDGDYYLSPKLTADYRLSNTDVLPERRLGIRLVGAKNVRLTGNGARLWCSGRMQPITIDRCENIEVSGFVIDWKKPMVAEGVVTAIGDGYVELFVDEKIFPHRFVIDAAGRQTIEFDIGSESEQIWSPLVYESSMIQFDSETRTVRRATDDRFQPKKIEIIDGEHIRIYADFINTALGNIFVLRHNAREHAGIFCEKSKNILLSDITVHSCGGLGVLAQFCEDITCRRVDFLPNRAAGRRIVSGRDDGMHITCCSGRVTITECSFLGLMDDPINVHSCCVNGVEWLNDRTIRCRYMHPQAQNFLWFIEEGDEIAFIERRHMNRICTARAKRFTPERPDEFIVEFDAALPENLRNIPTSELALDNLTHTASFICTKNRFGSCRARGVLVSVPKRVYIADNYFESSGSAILVAGDSNYWYESGACHDVEICGNVFTNACLSSMYQFCRGVISVCPVVPEPDVKLPYHENINIHDNIFDTAGTPVLYSYSARGLRFEHNHIFASPSADRWHPDGDLIRLEYTSDAVIGDNLIIGNLPLGRLSEKECESIASDF